MRCPIIGTFSVINTTPVVVTISNVADSPTADQLTVTGVPDAAVAGETVSEVTAGGPGVNVGVRVGASVKVAVLVGVAVGVKVKVGVNVGVRVNVGVLVGVNVGVKV